MNTTFTNYAEKKAKQFLNLLQGYTRGIRITAILILLLMGVSNAWAKTIYFAPSSEWKQANAWFQVWDGSKNSDFSETGIEGLYKADITETATKVWIKRMNPNGGEWDGGAGTTLSTYNYFYNSGWSNTMSRKNIIGTVTGGHIYFDNSTTNWTGNIQFVIGHSGYSRTYEMTQIENTQLWYVNLTNKEYHTWGDATYYGFIASSKKFGDGEWGSGNLSKASNYTAAYTSTYSLNDGGTYYCKPSSASNGKSFTITYANGYSAIPKNNATQAAKLRNDITTSYAIVNGTWPTTLKLQGTYLSGNGTSARSEISGTASGNAESKRIYGAVVTGKITHTYSTITGNYIFEGWGTGTTPSTTNTTYEYNITASTTVYAFFTKAHTVTYSCVPTAAANAPTTTPSVTSGSLVASGTSVTFTAQAAKTGYTWEGWYSNNSGTGDALSTNLSYTRSITANTTIYAVYTANTYTVEFDANGGSGNMSDQNFTYGTAQNLIANTFTRTGYTFAGWATSANGTKVYDDKQSVSNLSSTNGATVTLYAKWTPINYTITYNTNGGNSIANKTYTIETATFDLPTPTKDGCTFVGWYDNEGLTGDAVTQIAKGSYGDKTFYAKWDAEKFTLTWNANGGTITTPGSPEGGEVEAGTQLKAPIVTKDHYDHTGWTPEEPTVMPGEDVTYIAQWTPKKYTITYNLNGGSGTMTPTTYTIESETFELPKNPTKTGHTFAGWYANAELTGEEVTQIEKGSTGNKAYWAKWDVASYTINFDLEGGTGGTTTELTVPFEAQLPDITIPTKAGYLFLGYYDGDNGTGTQYYDASGKGLKTMPANNLTLHAKWLNGSDCIFFYNNLGWSNVYVYFYSSDKYWDDSKGTGSQKEKTFPQDGDANHKPHYYGYRGKMTKIEGTNIWYYNRSVHSEIKRDNYSCVAFTKDQQDEHEWFWKTEVVRRGDYSSSLPMFVSMKADGARKNESTYYNHGYWMNYPTNTGYTLKIYDKVGDNANEWKSIPFEYSEDMMMPLTLSVSGMESGKTYGFKILRADDKWYGNNSTMTTGHSGDAGQTAWEFTTDTKNCGLTTTAAGTYVFTLKYGKDRNSNYNYLVGVEYPASVGDYRLAYKDNAHPFHPGHLLKKRDGKDTVSFFVHYNENPVNNENPVIILQQVTAINAQTGDITWNTISTTEINGISATGIYNFILEQSGNVATLLNTITEYDGDFYIRTDATAGGWGNFRQKSNKMTYTSYAENQEKGFNHYFVEWINGGTNVKFTIANDYSYCLSDSLDADDIVTTGNLPANANVRFGWHSKTNKLTRAYISGSSNVADRYLVLTGDDKLTDMDNQNFNIDGLHQHEAIFQDMGNWIYQLDAKAGRGASIQLTARYNEKDQTFFNTSAVALAEEGNETKYPVRFIYDFKTNNLMAAWLLEEENQNDIAGGNDLNANMLLLRRHHNQAQQIQLSNTLRAVGTAYGVMTFEKSFLNDNTKSIYERALYWISFPFDVCIRDVFGFGEYMDTWIMEYYDGEARAKNGAWVDSESYWTYMTNVNDTLKAGVGYVLCLDLDKMGADSKVFEHTSEVSLYFPSATSIGDIDVNQAVSITVPEYKCAINRQTPQGDRRIADSNWNVIGVPRFINLNITLDGGTIDQQNIVYYYQYNASNNTYQAAVNSGEQTFQTMQAYMVQYAGTIDWWEMANWPPQQLAARRNANATSEKVNLRLEIAQDDVAADKTFIQLQEEGATADFDMNKDLTKIINAGTNIYTIVGEGNVLTAGNVMPMSECVVPVGVKIDAEGEYTFRMPDGTEGMVVELIDYELETKTNLLLFDYTVDLSAGTCNDRFALHIQPNKSGVTTGVEEAYPQPLPKGKGAKFLIDGKLVIRTAEGVIYDAQGHVVQ